MSWLFLVCTVLFLCVPHIWMRHLCVAWLLHVRHAHEQVNESCHDLFLCVTCLIFFWSYAGHDSFIHMRAMPHKSHICSRKRAPCVRTHFWKTKFKIAVHRTCVWHASRFGQLERWYSNIYISAAYHTIYKFVTYVEHMEMAEHDTNIWHVLPSRRQILKYRHICSWHVLPSQRQILKYRHTYMHTHTHTLTHTHIYINTHTHIWSSACSGLGSDMIEDTWACHVQRIRTQILNTHTCMYTYTHTYEPQHTHMYIYIHTHMWTSACPRT